MRKLLAGLVVSLCTFCLGVASIFIVCGLSQLKFPNSGGMSNVSLSPCQANTALDPKAGTKSSSADLVTLTYRELADNSACYDGKVVRVRARLSWDDHGLYLYDENRRHENALVWLNDSSIGEFSRKLKAVCGGGVCRASLDVDVIGVFEKAEALSQPEASGEVSPFRFNIKQTESLSLSNLPVVP